MSGSTRTSCGTPAARGTLLHETMGDARLTADIHGHQGLASVTRHTKIADAWRCEAYEEMHSREF